MPETKQIKGKILLIHGLAGSTFSWRSNIDPLIAQGYLVVPLICPGSAIVTASPVLT